MPKVKEGLLVGCVAYIIKAVRDDTCGKGGAHSLTAVGEEEEEGGRRRGGRESESEGRRGRKEKAVDVESIIGLERDWTLWSVEESTFAPNDNTGTSNQA